MSLKARIGRLEREVHWLKYEGWARSLEMQMKLMETMTALDEHKAKAAAKETSRSEEPREARRLEGAAPETVPTPILRDASLHDVPQDEVVGAQPAAPLVLPFVYDPPEHMQIRPVTWRLRTAEDDWDDDDDDDLGPYQVATEYDPLAED